jgi:uncharacterized protein YndB with AHSA1/START domain
MAANALNLEREIVITRILDAPRKLVFEAWTHPRHLVQWWGPAGFTNPVCEMDVRPGGTWYIVMRGPDGSEYPGGGVYREIVPPERLVFTNNAFDPAGKVILEGHTTVTFADEGRKTKLVLTTRAKALDDYTARFLAGMEAGWTQSMERLAQHVTADRSIVATRVFDAPRELVFDAFTDPEHISNWWGPRGFTTTTYEMDVRPGGIWRHTMHGPDGADYENEIIYVEVARPALIVYDHISKPLFRSTIGFEDHCGKTRLTMHMLFATAEEREWVARTHGAVEGAQQTLARLAELLAAGQQPNSAR